MIIQILRHGETIYNRELRYQGWKDIPLSEAGKEELFASALQPERVYVSGLQRTAQTAGCIFPQAELIPVPGLNEMHFGAFEGRSWIEMRDDPAYREWTGSGCTTRCPGGEDRAGFSERIGETLCSLAAEEAARGSSGIFIVAHGGTIMAAMERFCTDRAGEYREWLPGNGEGYEIESREEGGTLHWHVRRSVSYAKHSGRVHLYCGEGRGKTSIAMGTALRAIEHGWEVSVLQLCKNGGSGETAQLEKAGAAVFYGKDTKGFVSAMGEAERKALKERQSALLKRIIDDLRSRREVPGRMLILDEVCAALDEDVLDRDLLWDLLIRRPAGTEILMTGRYPADWLLEAADYVTELNAVKHPYRDGLRAREGVEY